MTGSASVVGGSVATISITDPAGVTARVTLTGDRRVIGRSQEADIHLPSSHVSRRHAELTRDPFGRWWIRDLGSQNGTLVNGQNVKESVVHPGDEIAVGDFVIRLELPNLRHDHTTTSASRMSVSRAAMGPISALKDHQAPRIAREHLTQLMELNRHLQNVAEPGERYRLLCKTLTSPEFHCTWAGAMRISATEEEPTPELLCEPQFAREGEEVGPLSRGLLRAVQAKREAVMAASSTQGAADVMLSMAGAMQGVAAVACPLAHDAEKIDLLYIMLPGQFATGEWLGLASLAAEEFQHAEAAHRAREQAAAHAALEQELNNARRIQMSLIPQELAHAGVDVAVGFMPCRWVGGDYVDVVPMGDGRLLLAVADVCGKGLPAALLAARVHTGVHSNLAAGMSLQKLMTNLNNYLVKTIPAGSFVTMIALAVDVGTGEIEFVNAGHPPPIVAQGGAASRSFAEGLNMPLGLEAGTLAAQHDVLGAGETLAVFTDGLTELADEAREMLGEAGLGRELQVICSLPEVTTSGAAGALKLRLVQLLGDQLPQDDQTFLLVKRL